MLYNNKHMLEGFQDAAKEAATRYEKEIAKGTIQRSDLLPTMTTNIPGILGAGQRKATRDALYAYEPPTRGPGFTEEQATALRQKQHISQMQNADMYVPGIPKGSLDPVPNAFAGTAPNKQVFTPTESGQFIRTVNKSPLRAAEVVAQAPFTPAYKDKLEPANPSIDPHITHAVGQHELGEAEAMANVDRRLQQKMQAAEAAGVPYNRDVDPPRNHANASHLGMEPIHRENISLSKAPAGAVSEMQQVRQANSDDRLTAKLIRRAGGTPNAPLPLDSKATRAVERAYEALPVSSLDKTTRGMNVTRNMIAPQLGVPTHFPAEVQHTALKKLVEDMKSGKVPLMQGAKDGLRRAASLYKYLGS